MTMYQLDFLNPDTQNFRGLQLLDYAIEQFNPKHVFALFSGGHDSLSSTHMASKHPKFTAAVHINTGIGVEETRVFVRETCRQNGWPLLEYFAENCLQRGSPDSPKSFRDIVLKWGFPGPPGHRICYNRLKERCIEALIRDHSQGPGDIIALVTGCRSQESQRRMGNVEQLQFEPKRKRLWVSIIHHFSKVDVNAYILKQGLQRNPVVDTIHKSGECLCGAFAKKGELAELELWYPDTARKIRDLESEARKKGFYWGWEDRPPESFLMEQHGQEPLPLCQSCPTQEKYEDGEEESRIHSARLNSDETSNKGIQ